MIPSPTLAKVARGDLCSGCGLCAALGGDAVGMAMAPPGYLRPVQSASLAPAAEAAIAATCPAVVVDERHPPAIDDALWGPCRVVATGYATDAALRHNASSGGIISALAIRALATGLVDFVVQTAADPLAPLANRTAASATPADIFAAAGSRYTASSPLADLETWLARPGRFAFVGKPCDVTALRALARIDPRIDAKVPLMLAFFCAGIPSAAGTRRILDRLGVKDSDVASFRYRGDGWPGFATATRHDGSTARMSYADSWGEILSKEVQFRCKICPDAVGGDADIVAADAWYGDERGYPTFDEQDGRSLVIARTESGAAFLAAVEAAGALATAPLPLTEIAKMQPAQARRKRQVLARVAALAAAGRPRPHYRGVRLVAAARMAPLAENLRGFLGALRRIVGRRR